MEMPIKPEFDLATAAEEIKKHLDDKKYELVDYGFANIDLWFNEEDLDGKYPVVTAIMDHWRDLFDYADTVTKDDGTGFPNDEFLDLEADLKKIENLVNADSAYWKALRAEIIPLYEKSPHYSKWQKRWKCVELFYDAVPMDVTTTEIFTNPTTGERTRGKVRSRTIPDGIVIRIDKTKKKGGPGVLKTNSGYQPPVN